MNFEEFIRYVTGQDREPHALKDFKAYLVEYFFLEHPNALRPQIEKDAEQWAELIIDKRKREFINDIYAARVREQFLKFKEEDKSRKAKKSRSMRKPDEQGKKTSPKRGRVKRKDDKRLGARLPG
jgi:hypothetical protein